MTLPDPDSMTAAERRAGMSLAAIFALRMLGLFLILPVFAAHAHLFEGGDNLTLVGLAIGAYGLAQAVLQLPFGAASDRFGRKPVIVTGLLIFIAGSVLAALADSIYMVILGRVLQGAGAISAAVTALAADLTRDQHRTKIMAMIGSSIGLVFALSMVAAPLLYAVVGMSGIFWLTALLAAGAIFVVLRVVPDAPPAPRPSPGRLRDVLRNGQLMRLNAGVFALHLIQTTMWVVVPAALVSGAGLAVPEHWKVYLPAVLLSFVVMVPAIIVAERRGLMKPVFNAAIVLLVIVQAGLYIYPDGVWSLGLWSPSFSLPSMCWRPPSPHGFRASRPPTQKAWRWACITPCSRWVCFWGACWAAGSASIMAIRPSTQSVPYWPCCGWCWPWACRLRPVVPRPRPGSPAEPQIENTHRRTGWHPSIKSF